MSVQTPQPLIWLARSETSSWVDFGSDELPITRLALANRLPNLVATWRESTVFTEAEQAALALAEEGTRLADAHLGVSDDTWALARKHYDDDQLAALVSLVALINAANRLAVILHQKGGSYETGMFAKSN